jgi:hypothetical protein
LLAAASGQIKPRTIIFKTTNGNPSIIPLPIMIEKSSY